MTKKTVKLESADQVPMDNNDTGTAQAKTVDLSASVIQRAIADGRVLIEQGKSKAESARAIHSALRTESKDVIVAAFVEGATLTPKGALTYWYNCERRAAKKAALG